MSTMKELIEELDALSSEISNIGMEKNDPNESPVFFKLSEKLDDIIMKYGDEPTPEPDYNAFDDQGESRGC